MSYRYIENERWCVLWYIPAGNKRLIPCIPSVIKIISYPMNLAPQELCCEHRQPRVLDPLLHCTVLDEIQRYQDKQGGRLFRFWHGGTDVYRQRGLET